MQTFGFFPAELSCLTPIVVHSIGFCDISEGNVQDIQKRGKMVILGTFSSPCDAILPRKGPVTRTMSKRLQEDWARAAEEGPRVLMNLRVDF